MKKIWEVFPWLAAAVRADHFKEGMIGSGHDFEHAARVAQYAYLVAPEDCKLHAGAAGLCHNADRILQRRLGLGHRDVSEDKIRELVRYWLEAEGIIPQEVIFNAVLNHGGKNDDSDSPVLVALMDADRIVNIEFDIVIRCAQHYSDLPPVDFRYLLEDPTADYRNPKSVFRDIYHSLEWDTDPRFALRTPKAIEMGKSRFAALRFYIETLKKQIEESGLVPYPF